MKQQRPQFASWALACRGYKATYKAVLVALAERANPDGVTWPSVETIGWTLGVGVRMVQYALRRLEADGILEIVDRPGPRSNLYRLNLALLERRAREAEAERQELMRAARARRAVQKPQVTEPARPGPVMLPVLHRISTGESARVDAASKCLKMPPRACGENCGSSVEAGPRMVQSVAPRTPSIKDKDTTARAAGISASYRAHRARAPALVRGGRRAGG